MDLYMYVPAHAADRVVMSHPTNVYISPDSFCRMMDDTCNYKAIRGGW
jgi:hypothetical protein